MRKRLVASLSLIGLIPFSLSSFAADLAVRPTYKAPALVPAPVINPWTGLYAGFNADYMWEQFGSGDMPRVSTGDGAFGAQVGYNWLSGNLLYGVEGDIQATTGHLGDASGTCGGAPCTLRARLNGFGTIRGRIGTLWGPGMVYLTGGAAFLDVGADLASAGGEATTGGTWRTGWSVGGGYEQMLWDRWSGKLEYLYMSAGGPSLTAGAITRSIDTQEHLLRAGLNYHF